jgi:putative PIN family toxin of toxin-antitoxin system
MRVVLDTNIVVSSYIVRLGNPAYIVAAWFAGRFDVPVSEALLEEYRRILNSADLRRRLGWTAADVDRRIEALREQAIVVEIDEVPAVVTTDPDDDIVIATAVAGHADYIVTGDPDLLDLGEYRGIRIVRPATFVSVLEGA